MPRPRYERQRRQLGWWQEQFFEFGPPIPVDMATGESAYVLGLDDPVPGERSAFRTLREARDAWPFYRDEVMVRHTGPVWAWQQWDQVMVSDLVGGTE